MSIHFKSGTVRHLYQAKFIKDWVNVGYSPDIDQCFRTGNDTFKLFLWYNIYINMIPAVFGFKGGIL